MAIKIPEFKIICYVWSDMNIASIYIYIQQETGENYVIRSSIMISLRRILSQGCDVWHAWEKIQNFDGQM